MYIKQQTAMVLVLLMSLIISGCGPGQLFGPTPTPTPTFLTDEEFTKVAHGVCSNLKTEIAPLDPFILFDLTSKADAYKRAADVLADLEITEQSAPYGTLLRSGLAELADSLDMVDKVLSEAIIKADLGESDITIIITEGGEVFAYTDSIFEATYLEEIDASQIENLQSIQEQVRAAAMSLNLEDCAIEE
jgi:hypothetical protein